MTLDEAKSVIKALRGQGASDNQIAYSFAMMFINKKIDGNAYLGLIDALGYHLSDKKIYKMDDAEKIKYLKKMYGIK